ncbi:MAG TPA: fumarylacetoacetate hydrolase family protein [Alphaproteobacteria bacterium]|jgi:2-keto-4-pentenoate hydratase/2-oxohepta-3-ene-1,7-dioic acid hydratase in catechol pathway
MVQWIRFEAGGDAGFGTLEGEKIAVHDGDMFGAAKPSGRELALADVTLLTPCAPSKMVCLWNNSRASAAKNALTPPETPLHFLKAPTAFLAGGQTIPRPASYGGRVLYEGELGIVIGKRCARVSEEEAAGYIFGYTCVNDVTALELLNQDASFAQWARCKGFDGFGPFGPAIATGLDPAGLTIRSLLDGRERQNYGVSDMFFAPHRLVSLISQDMTLLPGDVISCGTSLGALPMKPGAVIEIAIDGVGTLKNVMG